MCLENCQQSAWGAHTQTGTTAVQGCVLCIQVFILFFPSLGSSSETLVRCCAHSPGMSHQRRHGEDMGDNAEPQAPDLRVV